MNHKMKCSIEQKCGGCQYLSKSYETTLSIKKQYVMDCFLKEKIVCQVNHVYGAKNVYQYRNKMILGVQWKQNKYIYGFYEENTHKIIPLDFCLLHSNIQNEIAKNIFDLIVQFHIPPYDEDRKTGLLRYICIRESYHTQKCLVTLVTAKSEFPSRGELVKKIIEKCPNVQTIIQNINPRKTSIVLGEQERILYGKGYIEDKLCGLTFQITSKSFYQVNPEQTQVLYQLVHDFGNFQKDEVIIDAYSGVGTIGFTLSPYVKEIFSVENNSQAVYFAKKNAKENHIHNVFIIQEDATKFLLNFLDEGKRIDTIIMDPPRSGSTPIFLSSVLKLKPKQLIYVSCNPETLARDLKILLNKYKIKKIALVDMFCWTKHIETIVLLTLKN